MEFNFDVPVKHCLLSTYTSMSTSMLGTHLHTMIKTRHFDFGIRFWPISAPMSKTLHRSRIRRLVLSVICVCKDFDLHFFGWPSLNKRNWSKPLSPIKLALGVGGGIWRGTHLYALWGTDASLHSTVFCGSYNVIYLHTIPWVFTKRQKTRTAIFSFNDAIVVVVVAAVVVVVVAVVGLVAKKRRKTSESKGLGTSSETHIFGLSWNWTDRWSNFQTQKKIQIKQKIH